MWPCSIILAEYVWQQRSRFSGANVVEVNVADDKIRLVQNLRVLSILC